MMASSSLQELHLFCCVESSSSPLRPPLHKKTTTTRSWRSAKDLQSAVVHFPRAQFSDAIAALKDQGRPPKGQREKLWREFFSDPSQWWDHRSEKMNARYPDFTHKQTRLGLWLYDCCKPAWVDVEIAAMVPGTVQLNMFTWNKRLAEYVKTRQAEKAMQLFQHLQQDSMKPDKITFVQVLNACASL
ncbi:unnamed protein product [Sphagnum jensenii]|uniref:Uncharacterized protein n=1 Tax=Sphagnum jensenii TaxID=128206 RepID=A0ABP1B4L4_9BRYO